MCDHEPLVGPSTDPDGKELQYFSRYEPAFKGLQKLVMDKIDEVLRKISVSFIIILSAIQCWFFFIGTQVDWSRFTMLY